ncbi:hypothetical protein ACFSCX_10310 [Bacillus salitolerans]|uniref:Uncharacterized protein n=1 Tax=Bacillus salitolerans TaxID=1437434 RepID=A0ABW4LP59_9BACI
MVKKSLLSTFIFTLVVVNLLLWPYLYKQATSSGDSSPRSEEVSQEVETPIDSSEMDDPETSVEDQAGSETSEDLEEEEANETSNEFKVIDIK